MIWGIGTLLITLKYPKNRTTERSDSFLHLMENSLDVRRVVEHFRLIFVFLAAVVVDLGSESLSISNDKNKNTK